jgi:hypothetical protein
MATDLNRDAELEPTPAWLDETVVLEPEPEPEGVEVEPAGSVLDVIRGRRSAKAAEHEYDMPVPGYGGLLVVRCAPLAGEALTPLRLRLERSKDPSRDFALAADILIAATENVLARREARAELEPLDPTGDPVTFTERLAELLRIEEIDPRHPARSLVRAVFSLAPSPELAVGDAVGEYLLWAQGADADLDEGLLGES